jgi:inositol transport system substrate-binding protein
MKKVLTMLLGVVLVLSLLAENGFAKKKEIVIGVSLLNVANEFIVNIKESIESKAKKLKVRIIVNDAERSAEKQVQQVESFIAQKVNAIILNPCEVEGSSPAVDKAIKAKIPIININSETRSVPTAFVGSRDEESAEIAMNFIAKRLNGKGNILMMHGYPGQAAEIKRTKGAKSTLKKYPGLQLIAEQTANWSREDAMALMENWLQAYKGKINAVFAQNDEMGMGALKALESAGVKDKIVLVSVDAIADALKAVKDGRLDATVFQDAKGQGAMAVETAVKIIKRQSYQKQVFIPFVLITKENVDKYLKK